jgi:uncharacterized protein YdhG (YjbR/CyaY superfamily)
VAKKSKAVSFKSDERKPNKPPSARSTSPKPKSAKPKDIEGYLAVLNDDQRAVLQKLRTIIRAAAPQAEECISYGLAAFRLDGKPLVGMGAAANHCAFYLMSGSTVGAHADVLKEYDTSKGAIRFPADQPLPAALVRKLVKARIAENEELLRRAK